MPTPWRVIVFVAAIVFTPLIASAATITFYTDPNLFPTPFVLEDFNDTTLVSGLTITTDAGSISGGVFNDRVVPGGAQTQFNFANAISAFGGIWDLSPGGAGTGIRITLGFPGGGTQLLSLEVPNSWAGQFGGFSSDVPFTSVLLQAGTQGGVAETYNLDNARLGQASVVPEPTTLLLLGSGIAAAAERRRRRNTSADC